MINKYLEQIKFKDDIKFTRFITDASNDKKVVDLSFEKSLEKKRVVFEDEEVIAINKGYLKFKKQQILPKNDFTVSFDVKFTYSQMCPIFEFCDEMAPDVNRLAFYCYNEESCYLAMTP